MIDLSFKTALQQWCIKYSLYLPDGLLSLVQQTNFEQCTPALPNSTDKNLGINISNQQQLRYVLKDIFEHIKQQEVLCMRSIKVWCQFNDDDLVAACQLELEIFIQILESFFTLCHAKVELIHLQNSRYYVFSQSRRSKSTDDIVHYQQIVCTQLFLLADRMKQIDPLFNAINLQIQFYIDTFHSSIPAL